MNIKYVEGETLQGLFKRNLGITDVKEVNSWWIKGKNLEYRIDKLTYAVGLIRQYKNKKIVICGDYDTDGITSTTILLLTLKWFGCTDVEFKIPRRFSEGFGINCRMIEEIKADNALIITCDNGVAQLEAIDYAKAKGFAVCVIDHHDPVVEDGKIILPNADVVIDPCAIEGSADFSGYCGAGLCYRLACEMLDNEAMRNVLLSVAAIGTVGDVMMLHEENYYIVRRGTQLLLKSTTLGIKQLLVELGIEDCITSTDIGFSVCPAVNAISRLNDDGAEKAVMALSCMSSEADAKYYATLLKEWNNKRKECKKVGAEKADALIKAEKIDTTKPISLYIPDFEEGILGLIASQMMNTYHVPVVIFTDTVNSTDGEKCIKASARSCGNCNIKEALDAINDKNSNIFVAYGGHEGAAGLTIRKRYFKTFRSELINECSEFAYTDDSVVVEITVDQVNAVANEMQKYEPYGQGNPAPTFMIADFKPEIDKKTSSKKVVMKGGTVKFTSKGISAIGFGMEEALADIDNSVQSLRIVGTINDNWFRGRCTRQILADVIEKTA